MDLDTDRLEDDARIEINVRVKLAFDEVFVFQRDFLWLLLNPAVDRPLYPFSRTSWQVSHQGARIEVLVDAVANPISRKRSSLSLAFATNSGIFSTSPISFSIFAASLAPPCTGPQRLPAAIRAMDCAGRSGQWTVDVDAFCSWSA